MGVSFFIKKYRYNFQSIRIISIIESHLFSRRVNFTFRIKKIAHFYLLCATYMSSEQKIERLRFFYDKLTILILFLFIYSDIKS